jgi:putative N6-adenine-specific DNA methylase
MAASTAFDKRLKRRLVGRRLALFAATAPGLEALCLRELTALPCGIQDATAVAGGVSFTGRLQDIFLANLCLRTATRVLLRLLEFKATNFPTLEKRLMAIDWELYLPPDQMPDFNVATHRCRLYHTGAIADRLRAAIADRLGTGPSAHRTAEDNLAMKGRSLTPALFIRGAEDHFTVSVDSSGAGLYRRGIKKQVTEAPLRETVAAGALLQVGYSPAEPLVDPMCGSGTFSLEAAMMAQNIPAGWFRDFAFFQWPVFRISSGRWHHLRSRLQERIRRVDGPVIFSSDREAAACSALEHNCAASGLASAVQVVQADFFDRNPSELFADPGLLVLNPPFGKRLGSPAVSDRLFRRIRTKLTRDYRGWKAALVIPRRRLLREIPFRAAVTGVIHGGLRLFIATGRVPG